LFTQEIDGTIVDPLGSLKNIMMLTRQRRVSLHQNTSRNISRDLKGKHLFAALTAGKVANLYQNLKYTSKYTQERNHTAALTAGNIS
jgi:hypothetical protein